MGQDAASFVAPGDALMKRYFWFSYHAPPRERRREEDEHLSLPHALGLHQVRDGAAFAELAAAIQPLGYEYGGLILNIPRQTKRDVTLGESDDHSGTLPADQPKWPPHDNFSADEVHSSDLLVLPTRPPLDDDPGVDKRIISKSTTKLEEKVMKAVRPFFAECCRARIQFTPELASKLPPGQRGKRKLFFKQYDVATYKDSPETTAGFLVFVPEIEPDGPSLLVAFGMGGVETLVWTHWVRVNGLQLLQDLLSSREKRFVMAEFGVPRCSNIPTLLRFADRCHANKILDIPLT